MTNMEITELFLKTAFCCMACDGSIAEREIALINRMVQNYDIFEGIEHQSLLRGYVAAINADGSKFLNDYLEEVKVADICDDDALKLIKIAIAIIEADEHIEYSEISFFKKIRKNLTISDETILSVLPDKEDYLLPDVADDNIFEWNIDLTNINVNMF